MHDIQMIESFLHTLKYPEDRVEAALDLLQGNESAKEDLLLPNELCQALKISLTTLWRLSPPYIKVGQRKRYVLKEVIEFLSK